MVVVYIISVIYSIAFAISGSLLLTTLIVKKSNDIGDSKGQPADFAQGFKITRNDDNITHWKYLGGKNKDENGDWFLSDYEGYL